MGGEIKETKNTPFTFTIKDLLIGPIWRVAHPSYGFLSYYNKIK
jgi:hypothetical protein